VCSLSADEIEQYRGTLTEPGQATAPTASRSVEENLDLFAPHAAGEFADGSRTCCAPRSTWPANMNLRDPPMYRILHAHHHRTGDTWCIYPMYDYAHGQSRTHRGHHALHLHAGVRGPPAALRLVLDRWASALRPQQIEFAKLNLTYTLLSKRRLLELVKEAT
jgi:glutaminyl-tRNA synthetase